MGLFRWSASFLNLSLYIPPISCTPMNLRRTVPMALIPEIDFPIPERKVFIPCFHKNGCFYGLMAPPSLTTFNPQKSRLLSKSAFLLEILQSCLPYVSVGLGGSEHDGEVIELFMEGFFDFLGFPIGKDDDFSLSGAYQGSCFSIEQGLDGGGA